jgi:hypothetical protein
MTTKEQLNIKVPALKRPTLKELQKDRSWIKSIESDNSTEKACILNLATVLEKGENYITAEEYEMRTKDISSLGFQHAEWLIKNQDKFPQFKELLGKIYINFQGLVVVGEGGDRFCPCVDDGGGRFVQHWRWMGRDLYRGGRVAVSGKSLEKLGTLALENLDARIFELEKFKKSVEKILKLE